MQDPYSPNAGRSSGVSGIILTLVVVLLVVGSGYLIYRHLRKNTPSSSSVIPGSNVPGFQTPTATQPQITLADFVNARPKIGYNKAAGPSLGTVDAGAVRR